MEQAKKGTRSTQKRSLERIALLLDTAEQLLLERNADDISLADISQIAQVPLPSIYNFFPNKSALFEALANRFHCEIGDTGKLINNTPFTSWQAFIESALRAGAAYQNANPSMMKLFLGAGVSAEIRKVDVTGNRVIAAALSDILTQKFVFAGGSDIELKMSVTLSICDGVWQLSYAEHEYITDEYILEGVRAAIAYLRAYLPEYLALRGGL